MNRRQSAKYMAGAGAILGAPHVAWAQAVSMRLHHFVPAQSNQRKYWFEPWAKKLGEASNGQLRSRSIRQCSSVI